MLGLVGFTSRTHLSPHALDARLEALKSNLIVPNDHTAHDILFGPQTAGTLICPQWQTSPRTFQNRTGIIAWLEGDLFNRKTITDQRNWSMTSDIELLISLVTNPDHKSTLKMVDGLFSLILLDTHKNQLHILTDRYGLRPLYWHVTPTGLSWASEAKAFLKLPDFSPTIRPDTATTFLATGQLPPDQTWFEGVTQVPPASHIIYNTATGNLTRERYWWWDQISTRVGKINLTDAAQEFGHLFERAVKLRTQPDHQGLMLSGGLDSRAIFAALPGAAPTYTFGHANSTEVQIAAKVAAIRMSPHTILPLDQDNWLQPRMEAVWWTDGALNIMHMHGVEHLDTINQAIRVGFNGAGGDGLAGGGHLFESHNHHHYLSHNLHLQIENTPVARQHLDKAFIDAGSAHAFYIDWRMRGFSIHGPRMGLFKGIDYRLPFLDNDLQAFLFALPLSYKQNSTLYRQMLLHTFPAYFRDIPWARTGKPITWSKWALRSAKLLQKLQKKSQKNQFTNYPSWLREPNTQTVINTLLNTPTAQFSTITSPDTFKQLWADHLSGQDHSDQIGRYLTLELYLRQVFNNRYRTHEETQSLFTQK